MITIIEHFEDREDYTCEIVGCGNPANLYVYFDDDDDCGYICNKCWNERTEE